MKNFYLCMKSVIVLLTIVYFLIHPSLNNQLFAQSGKTYKMDQERKEELTRLANEFEQNYLERRSKAEKIAVEKGWDIRKVYPSGKVTELQC